MNTTCQVADDPLCFPVSSFPFYFSPKSSLVDGIPDVILTLAAPVLAYWALSLFFHGLDMSGWKWLDKYRLHDSAEVQARNIVTRTDVVVAVIFQQVLQTILGLVALSDESVHVVDHAQQLRDLAMTIERVVYPIGGRPVPLSILTSLASFVYWWAIPALQFLAAIFVIDTWQYFLHRAMHVNKFLYKHLHSWHHRLYVPYAFGALYNHPIEGFVLDSVGAILAEWMTGLSTRQAMLLFTISTFKTVDDHCGYTLPWDVLQWMTGNNADYHDIHHQVIGIKSNFAQPFFVHWDALLGTRMTRKDIEVRRRKTDKIQ